VVTPEFARVLLATFSVASPPSGLAKALGLTIAPALLARADEVIYVAASLTRINMAVEDPANESTYKARAAQYEKWRHALYAAEGNKSWARRIWERLTPRH